MNHVDHLLMALFAGLVAAFTASRFFQRVKQLEGRKQTLTRNIFISIFWGVIGASTAALALVIWSVTRDNSSLAFAAGGIAILVVCGICFVRSYLPLRKLDS